MGDVGLYSVMSKESYNRRRVAGTGGFVNVTVVENPLPSCFPRLPRSQQVSLVEQLKNHKLNLWMGDTQ